MHDDEKFDDFLRGAAKDYRLTPSARADEIWAAIEPDVAKAIRPSASVRSIRSLRTSGWIGIGIAATLVLGVAIGRWTAPSGTDQQLALRQAPTALEDSTGRGAYVRAAAFDHLAVAEVFLTTVRSDLKAGRADAERGEESRQLLIRTRLLLGSATNAAPEVKRLLEDLELLLAEIAALPAGSPMDRKLLNESMREGSVLPRIRATLPAASVGV